MKTEFTFGERTTVILRPENAQDEKLIELTFKNARELRLVNSALYGGGIGIEALTAQETFQDKRLPRLDDKVTGGVRYVENPTSSPQSSILKDLESSAREFEGSMMNDLQDGPYPALRKEHFELQSHQQDLHDRRKQLEDDPF